MIGQNEKGPPHGKSGPFVFRLVRNCPRVRRDCAGSPTRTAEGRSVTRPARPPAL